MRRHEIRRGGETIRLQQQPFQILALLMEHAGGVVTRQDIERRLWPDGTTVDFEHSVNAAIRRLRVALGDDALEPRFVETVPRRGYRFVGRLDPSGRVDERRPVAVARPRVLVRPFLVRGETPRRRPRPGADRGAGRAAGPSRRRSDRRADARAGAGRLRRARLLPRRRQHPRRRRSRARAGDADRRARRDAPVGERLRPRRRRCAERHDRRGVGHRGRRRGTPAPGAVRRIGGAGGEGRDAGTGRRRGRDRLEPARVGHGDRHQRHALVVVADALRASRTS